MSMRLEDLWEKSMLPLVDMETGEKIDSDVMLKYPDAEVLKFSCDGHFNILVMYEKEQQDEA